MFAINYFQAEDLGIEIILTKNSQLSYPLHNHISVFTIIMVLEGSSKLTIDKQSATIYKNQKFLITPYLPHKIESENNYSLLSICIRKNCLNNFTFPEIKNTLEKLLTAPLKKDFINCQHLDCLIDFFNKQIFPPETLPQQTFLDTLRKQIEDTPELIYRIDTMAKKVFSSKYHFIRNFKKVIGLTPHQFQIQNRIRKAQKLLTNTSTITEVALTTGFYDQSHFTKHFKKIVGLTPANYLLACHKLKINPDT